MIKQLEQVHEFNKAFGIHENKTFGALQSPAKAQLSIDMLAEELREYAQAMRDYNDVEVADALMDILYLTYGAILKHGLSPSTAIKLFNEVHASNMSKLDSDGKPIYRTDGKVMKSENYFKPNLKAILDEQD